MGANTGLLIIDVQKGSFKSGIPIHNERELLENTNILLDRAHTSGTPVFLVQYADDSSWAEGTENWQLHPGLHRSQGDATVCKRTSSALDDTSFQEHLRDMGITRLVTAGIASQWCVRSTCLHAKELGFEVTLAKDAHGPGDNPSRDIRRTLPGHIKHGVETGVSRNHR